MISWHTALAVALLAAATLPAIGCKASAPPRTGFISDYSQLEAVSDNKARFVSPELSAYDAFMVDPVQIQPVKEPAVLTPEERAEVANYFRDSFVEVLRDSGYTMPNAPGSASRGSGSR